MRNSEEINEYDIQKFYEKKKSLALKSLKQIN